MKNKYFVRVVGTTHYKCYKDPYLEDNYDGSFTYHNQPFSIESRKPPYRPRVTNYYIEATYFQITFSVWVYFLFIPIWRKTKYVDTIKSDEYPQEYIDNAIKRLKKDYENS